MFLLLFSPSMPIFEAHNNPMQSMNKLLATVTAAALGCLSLTAGNIEEREITVYNHGASITLAGTLTLPEGSRPRAAVVLASGSGAQNRDEELMGHRPFKVLAQALDQAGYAVVRMDDRGVGGSGGRYEDLTVEAYATDITSAFAKLDSLGLGGIPYGVIGHSAGGSTAIKVAAGSPGCKFIVTLAAPAWAGDSIVMSQARAMATAMTGRWDGEQTQRRIMDMVKSPLPTCILRASLYTELAGQVGEMANLPAVKAQIEKQIEGLCAPVYRDMVRYDPAADIAAIRVPWLALNGDKDCQVLPANLHTISSLKPEATVKLMPGHNHLFQNCTTGLVQEYATLTEDISPQTLTAVLTWLQQELR